MNARRLTDLKLSRFILYLSIVAYTIAYFGRYNFTITIVNFVASGLMTKTQCGVIGSIFLITYSVGQVVFGILAEKYSPFKLILFALLGSTIANLGIFFFNGFISILIFYAINGVVQSSFFSSMLGIFSERLAQPYGAKGINYVGLTFPIARIFGTGILIAISLILNFKYIFLFSAITLLIVSVFWIICISRVKKFTTLQKSNLNISVNSENESLETDIGLSEEALKIRNEYSSKSTIHLFLISGMFAIFVMTILRGFLDNSIVMWTAPMLFETFVITPEKVQAIVILLQLGSAFGIYLAVYLFNKIKCEIKTAILYFFLVLIPCLLLLYLRYNIYLSIIIFFSLYALVNGLFQAITIKIPTRFAAIGRSASVTGIVNGVACFGSLLASFIGGIISDNYGWTPVILVWIGACIIGMLFGVIVFKKWKKFRNDMEKIK